MNKLPVADQCFEHGPVRSDGSAHLYNQILGALISQTAILLGTQEDQLNTAGKS